MPTWGKILSELRGPNATGGKPDFDGVRRKYLKRLHDETGRAVILYATAWLESRPIPPAELQVGLTDVQGLMEAVSNIRERDLDLIIHSPGGSAEAAESLVEYLRERFDHIRVFVPVAAMSAATMMALAADKLVMGQHSQLGPIDPVPKTLKPRRLPSTSAPRASWNAPGCPRPHIRNRANLAFWTYSRSHRRPPTSLAPRVPRPFAPGAPAPTPQPPRSAFFIV